MSFLGDFGQVANFLGLFFLTYNMQIMFFSFAFPIGFLCCYRTRGIVFRETWEIAMGGKLTYMQIVIYYKLTRSC
jgi:hypothetical protein